MNEDITGAEEQPAGMDRRTMLKRSAIVGGALVWTTPLVQTIAQPAFADESPITIIGCPPGQTTILLGAKFEFDCQTSCDGARTGLPDKNNTGTCFAEAGTTSSIAEAPSSEIVSVKKTGETTLEVKIDGDCTLKSAGVKAGTECYQGTVTLVSTDATTGVKTYTVTIPSTAPSISNVLLVIECPCPVT